MRDTLYEFHLLKDGKYHKEYIRIKTTAELSFRIEQLKEQGYDILSVEVR